MFYIYDTVVVVVVVVVGDDDDRRNKIEGNRKRNYLCFGVKRNKLKKL